MLAYLQTYPEKLFEPLVEHITMLVIVMIISLIVAALLTLLAEYMPRFGKGAVEFFSLLYSVPSLALLVLMIPLTGLGQLTAIIVLVLYNQYLLLRNFLTGLQNVDPASIEIAEAMGMSTLQIVVKIRIPLAKSALFTGIRLATISTISIATIAALINAGGLGSLLFEGLRTDNMIKVVWGSLLVGGLAVVADALLSLATRKNR